MSCREQSTLNRNFEGSLTTADVQQQWIVLKHRKTYSLVIVYSGNSKRTFIYVLNLLQSIADHCHKLRFADGNRIYYALYYCRSNQKKNDKECIVQTSFWGSLPYSLHSLKHIPTITSRGIAICRVWFTWDKAFGCGGMGLESVSSRRASQA